MLHYTCIHDFIYATFCSIVMINSVCLFCTDKMSYKIDKEKLVVSKLFTLLNSVKIQLGITDWGIKRSTLEDGNGDVYS